MSERGYQWLVLVQGFLSWVYVIGPEAFTVEWLLFTLCVSAFWVLGLLLGWMFDPNALPMMIAKTALGLHRVTYQSELIFAMVPHRAWEEVKA